MNYKPAYITKRNTKAEYRQMFSLTVNYFLDDNKTLGVL